MVVNAAFKRSIHTPLLWSLTATQSIRLRIKASSHSSGVICFSVFWFGPLP